MLSILLSIHWADSVTFKVIWMKNATLVTVLFFLKRPTVGMQNGIDYRDIFALLHLQTFAPSWLFFLIFPDFNYNRNLLLFNKVNWKLFCIRLVLNSPVVIEGEMCESKTGENVFLYIQHLLQIGSSL